VVLGLLQDGACVHMVENHSVNSLKEDLSNAATFNPSLFSLVNTFKTSLKLTRKVSKIETAERFFETDAEIGKFYRKGDLGAYSFNRIQYTYTVNNREYYQRQLKVKKGVKCEKKKTVVTSKVVVAPEGLTASLIGNWIRSMPYSV
jgi:hypothetical protein